LLPNLAAKWRLTAKGRTLISRPLLLQGVSERGDEFGRIDRLV